MSQEEKTGSDSVADSQIALEEIEHPSLEQPKSRAEQAPKRFTKKGMSLLRAEGSSSIEDVVALVPGASSKLTVFLS